MTPTAASITTGSFALTPNNWLSTNFPAGEAPTLVSGVLQVNVAIPADINPGNQPVVLTIGNNSTKLQAITVAVQ